MERESKGESDYHCSTFLVDLVCLEGQQLEETEEGLQVVWGDFDLLLQSPFAEYNRKLGEALLEKDFISDDMKQRIKEAIL